MTETELAMKSLCERVTLKISGDTKHQALMPTMVHVVDRRDKRKQEALLGSEVFRFSHCLPAGKSLTFCFRPVRPASYRLMELTIDELPSLFPDFYSELTEYMSSDVDSYIKHYLALFEEKQHAAEQQEKIEKYGAGWGMF